MDRAETLLPAGSWSGVPVDSVVLDHDERYRRRVVMTGARGLVFLLDLPEAVTLRAGDGLALADGRVVEVVAAPEPLAEIRGADIAALVRVAWHLGNRHLATELMKTSLRIRRDPVIEDMARRLGARVVEIEAPFNPEGGAYISAPERTQTHVHPHRQGAERGRNDEHASDCQRPDHDRGYVQEAHAHGHKHER
jgi:urease accessory protein